MKRFGISLGMGCFFFFLLFAGRGLAPSAQAAEGAMKESYKGKNITFIVHYSPGGGYDATARTIAPFIEKYTGADKVIIRNIPGAAGLNGMNILWTSKPNGYTIGLMSGFNFVTSEISGQKGAKFDLEKFTYLGRISSTPFALATSAAGSLKTAEDIRKLNRSFTLGTTGAISANTISGKLMAKALGIDVKFVYGYGGNSEIIVAIARGDLDGLSTVADTILSQVKAGNFRPVLYLDMEKSPDFPDTPSFKEVKLAPGGQIYAEAVSYFGQLGRIVVAPPGVDEQKTAFLRNALWQAMNDPAFIAKAHKINQEVQPLEGEKAAALIKKTLHPSAEIMNTLKGS